MKALPQLTQVKNVQTIFFSTAGDLAFAVARAWLDEIVAASQKGNAYHVAISGGRIARNCFDAALAAARTLEASFAKVHFFWADERCVRPDDPESNFSLAKEYLLAPLRVPEGQIHRIRGEETPAFAAAQAEAEICRIAELNSDGQPVLDLILLGMGEDGHVASLFPGELESDAANRAVYRTVLASKPPPHRITLGYPAIAAARQVWVLVSGPGKESALRESLNPTGQTPLARVLRSRCHTRVLTEVKAG